MKRVCFDLQGGTNPVGIDRRLLSDVHEAFQLFVLQHDCHRDFFRRNVVDLLQKLPDQAKADTLIGLLMSCFRDIYSANRPISHNKSSRQPSQVVNEILDVMQEEQQPRLLPDTNMSIDLSCEFFGISTRSMD
ncbi:hypothetical protein LSH36_130g01046 [Paralvinella palmiformis]|uniref:Uncharacterized protein n=1 Tax=Paralvinella palmiformis TaxID=53620 RepID=A0AAD9JW86_9ANNE|nr:hypothetical protein LSH36_130g01046 [Paralvinella palmiformis]